MKINRMMTNICSSNLQESKKFYTRLFDFNVDYDSDWFIHLISKDKQLELGIVDSTNEIVPKEMNGIAGGSYMTIVVDDVDRLFEIAKSENFQVVEKPADTFYGQRRLLLKDPNDLIVDVSSPIPNFDN